MRPLIKRGSRFAPLPAEVLPSSHGSDLIKESPSSGPLSSALASAKISRDTRFGIFFELLGSRVWGPVGSPLSQQKFFPLRTEAITVGSKV